MAESGDSNRTAALIGRARAGSAEAVEALYSRCAPRLLALIRLRMGRSLRARLESRDILQATLFKSFQQISQLRSAETVSLMAWLARIAENEIRDQADRAGRQRRDVHREASMDEDVAKIAADLPSALSRVILDERAARLEQALETLSPDHREVILLRKFEELTFAEIAARLGRSEDACRMLLARAMTALTLKLAEMDR
jgi:RNA polymerase sigma-70 factor (ECF subfamily)